MNIPLRQDENIVLKSKISKTALIIFWCAIPGLYLFNFLVFTLPGIIKSTITNAAKDAIMEQIGITEDVSAESVLNAFGINFNIEVPAVVNTIVNVMVGVLVLVWFIFCVVVTIQSLRNELVFTDRSVIASSGNKSMIIPWDDVNDVFVEQPLLGKIFKYGNITISSKRGCMTVKNIFNPKMFREKFLYSLPD